MSRFPAAKRTSVALLAMAIAAFSPRAMAQADAPADAPKPVRIPPKVKTKVAPVYPPDKLAAGERATVKVELTIDATGKVTDAKILASAGDEFDQSALDAAKQLEFEPATVDGKPVPSRIPYRFDFDFEDVKKPVAPETPAETPKIAVGDISGVVRTPTEDPLPAASVTLTAPDGTTKTATTDLNGAFLFAGLPKGRYRLMVTAEGFTPFEAAEDVEGGKVVKTVYRPKLTTSGLEIEVKGERPPREVTVHTLDQTEISRIPGTNGDALRAVQSLPGVGRPPGLAGILIIRGSAPNETNYFIDGTLIPIVYHFGGLSSVVPTEVIDKLDFYPGNFGPEYGRVSGGIIDVNLRSPAKDKFHGLLQFDLIDGRFVLEGPIDKKTRFFVAGRRSWVDTWLGPVLRKTGAGVSTAPVYYDYQMMVERDVTASTTARLMFYGSNDRLAITLNTPSASDPTFGGDISSSTGFWRLQGRVETRVTDRVKWTNTLAYGRDFIEFNLGDNFFHLDSYPLSWRSDVRAKLSNEATAIAGIDYLWDRFDVGVKFPPPPIPGQTPGPFFARPPRELHATDALYRPGVYGQLDLQPIKGLRLLPGVRVDWTRDAQQWTIGPRFAARYSLVPEFPKTTIKGGVGIYHQAPQPQESIAPFGTPGVGNARATHYALGVEQDFTRNLDLSLEGFFKDLEKIIGADAAETTSASGVKYVNRGDGRTYGLELLLKWTRRKPDDRFFGWVAYTLSRAERRTDPTQPLTLYFWDQTHILTLLGSYRLGRGWEVGARFRYVSGHMYTPSLGGVVDFDAGAYQAIQQFPLNQARLPAFHQLDVRIDKVWNFKSWALAAYLDVQNVYNRQNPEGIGYNYNYTQSQVISGVPILPVIGLRGEFPGSQDTGGWR